MRTDAARAGFDAGATPVQRERAPEVDAAPCADAAGMRRVLIITFQYPPGHDTGTLRPLKLSKYLREFGWQPSVLTVTPACYPARDEALLREVPAGVRVHRTRCFDTKRALAVGGRYPGFLAIPDRYVSWLPFGVAAVRRVVRRERIDVLFSTSPIATAHLIALCARGLVRTPWVADLRDPWGADLHGPLRSPVERWLERRVLRGADRITVTTPEIGAYYRGRYGDGVGDKTTVVYNGYDEADFDGVGGAPRAADACAIVHSGVLYPEYRSPEPFLRALRICLDRGTLPRQTTLTFLGAGEFASSAAFTDLLAALQLHRVVRVLPRVPYREGLQMTANAGALLLLQGGDELGACIPNKAFEYLRLGRPILVVAPGESATARFMGRFEGVVLAPPADPEAIAARAAEFWAHAGRPLVHRRTELQDYTRRAAAARLAGVLGALAAERATT